MTKRLKRVPSALSGLRRAEPPKDLGEHGNAMIGGDIRRSPHRSSRENPQFLLPELTVPSSGNLGGRYL
jgi:hypothetical protein